MIIVRFDAGLGNQMLQYASYVALKKRYPNVKIVADIRNYNIAKIHNGLELEKIFPVKLNVLLGKRSKGVSTIGRYWHFAIHKSSIAFFKSGLSKFRLIQDNGELNKKLFQLDTSCNYYLMGQWGNEKYFESVRPLLKEHFSFKLPLDAVNEKRAEEINSNNSVGVHIRRGDYIGAASIFTELSISDYYPESFEYISKNTVDPVFYIFSDNVQWCKENLPWLANYQHSFITGNKGAESYKDLQLMSLCKHNILANSTFSWWGGWLNKNKDKIVICPKKLFNNEERNKKIVAEFYPAEWKKM